MTRFKEWVAEAYPRKSSVSAEMLEDARRGREALLKIARELKAGDGVPEELRAPLGALIEQMVVDNVAPLEATTGKSNIKGRDYDRDTLTVERDTVTPESKARTYSAEFLRAIAGDAKSNWRDAKYLGDAKRAPVKVLNNAVDEAMKVCGVKRRRTFRKYVAAKEPWCTRAGLDRVAAELGASRGEALVRLIKATRSYLEGARKLDQLTEQLRAHADREGDLFPTVRLVDDD